MFSSVPVCSLFLPLRCCVISCTAVDKMRNKCKTTSCPSFIPASSASFVAVNFQLK